jgi:hypothetical protein
LFKADDATKLGSSIVGANEMIIGCFSADTMFENIISLLN